MEILSIKQCAHALRQGELSSVELTKHYLAQIAIQNDLNAFISIDEEHALLAAQKADQELKMAKEKYSLEFQWP